MTDVPPDGSSGSGEDVDRTPEPVSDPTGLDLARRIAAAAGRSVPDASRRTPRKRQRGGSGSRRRAGDPVSVGDALEGVISDRGWGTEINVHLLLGRWVELVGAAVAEHSTPESYRDGVLKVRTSSTAWASQLRLMAPQLVARMNSSLGEGTIRLVTVLGPEAPSWKRGPRTVRGRGPRDTYG
ncbi:MAG: DUF721 domain-containing protein [Propioniciclava sp.]